MQKSAAAARRDVVCAAADITRVMMRVSRQHERDFQVLLLALLVSRMIGYAGDESEGSEGIAFLGGLVPTGLRAAQNDVGAWRHRFRDRHEIVGLGLVH